MDGDAPAPRNVSRARSARTVTGDASGQPRVSADGSTGDRPSRAAHAWEKVKQAPGVNTVVAFVNNVTGHDKEPVDQTPSLKFSE